MSSLTPPTASTLASARHPNRNASRHAVTMAIEPDRGYALATFETSHARIAGADHKAARMQSLTAHHPTSPPMELSFVDHCNLADLPWAKRPARVRLTAPFNPPPETPPHGHATASASPFGVLHINPPGCAYLAFSGWRSRAKETDVQVLAGLEDKTLESNWKNQPNPKR